jgi:DNA repair exonuclease SbcCD ATPase subunit
MDDQNDADFPYEAVDGEWVRYEDYARLKAEVERLTERNQHLEQIDSYLQSANLNAEEQRSLELEAQVERLTKAGDCLVIHLEACYRAEGYDPKDCDMIDNWNAAKKGGQP